jgi:hypothetical protein
LVFTLLLNLLRSKGHALFLGTATVRLFDRTPVPPLPARALSCSELPRVSSPAHGRHETVAPCWRSRPPTRLRRRHGSKRTAQPFRPTALVILFSAPLVLCLSNLFPPFLDREVLQEDERANRDSICLRWPLIV